MKKTKTNSSPLLLNIGFVARQSVGYSRTFTFYFPTATLKTDFDVQDLEGRISLIRTSEGLLAQGKFDAVVDTVCGRCLSSFKLNLQTEFAELITFADHAMEDTEIIYPEDGQFDFSPIIGEYLMLEVPINPICTANCKGLCTVCGNNLNTENCDHGPEPIDPRLEILRSLLDEE